MFRICLFFEMLPQFSSFSTLEMPAIHNTFLNVLGKCLNNSAPNESNYLYAYLYSIVQMRASNHTTHNTT